LRLTWSHALEAIMNKLRGLSIGIVFLLAGLVASAPVGAKNIGGDPPRRCSICGPCSQASTAGPGSNCSSSTAGDSASTGSLTEGNTSQSYPVSTVSSSTGLQLNLTLSYDSYNADTSRARLDTVAGTGWTHSENAFLYSVRGHMFRVGGDGRVTKYQLGAGGSFTAAPGYFEKMVKNPDGSFTITTKDQTASRFERIAGRPFMSGMQIWRLTRVTDRNNNVTVLAYSGGNLMSVTDTYGRSLGFTYNAQKKIASVTDPLSRVTTFSYDATGTKLEKITDPAGKTTQYNYNFLWQITGKTDKDGRSTSYAYTNQKPTGINDGSGTPYFSLANPSNWVIDDTALARDMVRQYLPGTTTRTDGRGNIWKYDYDSRAYVTRTVAPDGATWTYAYDPTTLMIASQTDANGRVTSYQYDTQGNLIKRTDALNNVTSYTYEPVFNMMTSMTDANGRTTTYQYDARGNRVKQTDPLLGVREWTYDARGNVLSEKDRNGNLTTYLYDAFGNRTRMTDAVGKVTTMAYDAVGNVITRTNARGFTTTYQYDGLNRLVKETDALGKITQTAYDGQGNQVQVIDRNGNATSYQYDQRQRLVRTTDALGQSSTAAYDGNNNRSAATDRNANGTSFQYDVQNRPTTATDAIGNVTTMAYDAVGNKLSDRDANTHSTAYQYDALDRMVRKTDAVANVTLLVYDTVGACPACTGPTKGSRLVTQQTDAEGKVTYFKYDALDRAIIVNRKQTDSADAIDGDDAVTRYSYDAHSNRTNLTEPNGNVTNYVYDALNRQVKMTNAAGDVTMTTYDPVSNIAGVTTPNLNVTTYTYDALDRRTRVDDSVGLVATASYDNVGNQLSQQDGNTNGSTTGYDAIYRITDVTDALGKTTHYAYDPVGNLLTTSDRENNATSSIYDNINRRTQTTDALGNVTRYQYDAVGNLTRVTDANTHATDYEYDNINRRVKEAYADGRLRSFTYDRVDNLKTRSDQKGQVTTYIYSDLYFLTQRDYPTSADDNMSYDLSGRMLSAERDGWLVTFTYDGANRVTQTVQNGQTLAYAYNIPGRTRLLTYPGGRAIMETADPRSRLDRIDDAGSPPPIVQYSYDAGNRVVFRNYRNGTTAAYAYNANNWITGLDHSKGVTRIAGFAYDFDKEGNKRFEDKLADSANSQTRSEAYQYDSIYRLIDYKVGTLVASTVPVPSTQTQYALDPVGNWNIKTTDAIPEARTHSVTNEITQIGVVPVLSDLNGNTDEDGLYRYAYDEENRLTVVTRKADSRLVGQYQYDALSRRVKKIADPPAVSSPVETRYFYDAARIVEDQSAGGATQATYVYGNYIDEVLTMDRDGQTFYYHQNSLWSVEAVSDSAGNVVERYAYDAYGLPAIFDGAGVAVAPNAWGTPSSAIGSPWMFTGRRLDEGTGIYFYRARYYDPLKGRFLQRDPLGYLDGVNLYAYVGNRPTAFTDPTGLFLCCDDLCDRDVVEDCKVEVAIASYASNPVINEGAQLLAEIPTSLNPIEIGADLIASLAGLYTTSDVLKAYFKVKEEAHGTFGGWNVYYRKVSYTKCEYEDCWWGYWQRLNWVQHAAPDTTWKEIKTIEKGRDAARVVNGGFIEESFVGRFSRTAALRYAAFIKLKLEDDCINSGGF
jgi:RHS repeat-associated protein